MHKRLFLWVIILLAAATRLFHIQDQSIWFDEGWSAYAAVQPTLIDALRADLTNPPLYYLLLNIAVRGFGDSPLALRYFSLLCGLLIIPLSYQLVRRLFSVQAGVYAAFAAAVSPLLWWASQEARMYTLLAALVLVTALAFHELLQRPTTAAWAGLVMGETLILYTHNTGPVAVLWINAAVLLAWLGRRSAVRPDWRMWAAGQASVAFFWLPWFIVGFLPLQEANSAVTSRPEISLLLFGQIWQAFWAGPWSMVGLLPVVIGAALFFVLWLALTPWERPGARWLLAHVLLLAGGLLLGLMVLENELHGRYLVMVAPLLVALLGAGIARLASRTLRYALCLLFGGWLFVVIVLAQNPGYDQHDDVRSMVQYYADRLTVGDSVLAWSYADRYDLWYYWDRLNVRARRITLPEGADLQTVIPLLPESGDVALNVWYTQRADYRGMMACVLGHGAVNPPEIYTVYGMSSLLYRAPQLSLPALRAFEGAVLVNNFESARIDAVGVFPDFVASQAVCLPIHLTVTRPLSADLKATILIRNRFGGEIARADAPFATANQRLTSQLAPGEKAEAYPLIRLPYGAPPGSYEVLLRVYDEQIAPSGFDLASPQARFVAKDLLLGRWEVIPGADWTAVELRTELPHRVNLTINPDLALLAHSAPEAALTVNNGAALPLALLWQGRGPLPALELAAVDGNWRTLVPADAGPRDSITLDWRLVQIPSEATSGLAELRLPDGTILGYFQVETLPFLAEAPHVSVEVSAAIPGIGTLVGYTLDEGVIDRARLLPLTLVWQAGAETISENYTVFVQLLNSEGRLIAQSDAIPAQNTRPTTGWRPGEYIIDPHQLRFNENAAPGPSVLIAGLYDAVSGQRLVVEADGIDYIVLPGTVEVR